MSLICQLTIIFGFFTLLLMPKPQERRAIEHFIRSYNDFGDPKIVSWNTELLQESPDAICRLSNGQQIALEHTSVYPPKQVNVSYPSPLEDLTPLSVVLDRKLRNDYRGFQLSQVWLYVQLRPTLPEKLVIEAVKNRVVPPHYDAVYIQWPVLNGSDQIELGMYEIRGRNLWLPKRFAA